MSIATDSYPREMTDDDPRDDHPHVVLFWDRIWSRLLPTRWVRHGGAYHAGTVWVVMFARPNGMCRPWWLPRWPRFLNRIFARAWGYFWLPCPICKENFGGHEWRSDAHLAVSLGRGKGVCEKQSCRDEARRRGDLIYRSPAGGK